MALECVICLADFVPGDIIISLPCDHDFHESCMYVPQNSILIEEHPGWQVAITCVRYADTMSLPERQMNGQHYCGAKYELQR